MIARIWKAWATPANAGAYEALFEDVILPHVTRGVSGYRQANLLKRTSGDEIEFTTIFWFDSLESIKAFAGEPIDRAVVPEEARRVLARYDPVVTHHQVLLQAPR